LFTLNGIFRATAHLLGRPNRSQVSEADEERARDYWRAVAEQIPDWGLAAEKKVTCAELRRDYLHAHGVALEALGLAGAKLLAVRAEWRDAVAGLRTVDWSRSNSTVWEGTALVEGRISKAPIHVNRTAELIARAFGVADAPAPRAKPPKTRRARRRS
jgi:DNA sulfur modification protein DndB